MTENHVRRQFRGCFFNIYIENGKIVLDPVKECDYG